jgi:hypothetical protein
MSRSPANIYPQYIGHKGDARKMKKEIEGVKKFLMKKNKMEV